MAAKSSRTAWGAGRVAFIARIDAIRSEMRQGYPLTMIFARHQTALGIRYQTFCKLVSRYAADARLAPVRARSDANPPPASAPALSTTSEARLPSLPAQGPSDARHLPGRRGFNHDPLERPDDRRRLLDED
jgi:hypothetical protein